MFVFSVVFGAGGDGSGGGGSGIVSVGIFLEICDC